MTATVGHERQFPVRFCARVWTGGSPLPANNSVLSSGEREGKGGPATVWLEQKSADKQLVSQ